MHIIPLLNCHYLNISFFLLLKSRLQFPHLVSLHHSPVQVKGREEDLVVRWSEIGFYAELSVVARLGQLQSHL